MINYKQPYSRIQQKNAIRTEMLNIFLCQVYEYEKCQQPAWEIVNMMYKLNGGGVGGVCVGCVCVCVCVCVGGGGGGGQMLSSCHPVDAQNGKIFFADLLMTLPWYVTVLLQPF